MKDEIFKNEIKKQFEFDENVASVFDDMISRSVPYYRESCELSGEILARSLKEKAKIIDLGCSTAEFLIALHHKRPDFELFGVDNSESMLKIAKRKSMAHGAKIDFKNEDILNCDFKGFDCAILNYTLQFIRPIKRSDFVAKIYSNLANNGILIMAEKLIYDDKVLAAQMIEIYENYKQKQGYSAFEIAQKRKALENILIPFSETENRQMLKNAGFKIVEVIFKWANFAVFLAKK